MSFKRIKIRHLITVFCLSLSTLLAHAEFTIEEARNILGVSISSSESEITKAYRRLAMRFHPDRLPPGASDEIIKLNEEEFKRIKSAHEILTGAPKDSVTLEFEPFVRQFGLFFYSPQDVSLLEVYYTSLTESFPDVSKLVQLRHRYLGYLPRSETKIDEIFVSVLKAKKTDETLRNVLKEILMFLNWNESFLGAVIESSILNDDSGKISSLREEILRRFLITPPSLNSILSFAQFAKSITPMAALEYWELYPDLRDNFEFASLVANQLIEGESELIKNNVSKLMDIVSKCSDRDKIFIFEVLLELHQTVLEQNTDLVDLLLNVKDFSHFRLTAFDGLIYQRASKQFLGRKLLNQLQEKDPSIFARELKGLEGSFLTHDSFDKFQKRYEEFLVPSKIPESSNTKVSDCDKLFDP